MLDQRKSGILLHPTSLPGRFGIGDLGDEARRFVDFLQAAGQRIWQVLPLGPTGFGDSPYQCFSALAGNPWLISIEELVKLGWLKPSELPAASFPEDEVDFGAVIECKTALLRKAAQSFRERARPAARAAFATFVARHASWLDDYALFMALQEANHGRPWNAWRRELAMRRPDALEDARREHAEAIENHQLRQYAFFTQWEALRRYAAERGVAIMGDIPIFVAHDSADVWTHPELFHLARDGSPSAVAGVPPDYFSATGQLWGTPLYRWDVMARDGHAWWIERFRAVFELCDLVRLDHFRGFEAYWEVPGGAETAIDGRWVKGPGAAFFAAVEATLGKLPIVAENLGVITPEVEVLRERFGYPGMAILQFAFGTDPDSPGLFLPHNYTRDLVVYTGTHDNDTTVGWFTPGAGDSTRSQDDASSERALCMKYLASDGREIHWDFIRAVFASVANTAIVPLQDVLGLGSEARMNLPGRPDGNWRWRYRAGNLADSLRDRLRELTELYGRAPRPGASPALDSQADTSRP